MGLEPTQVKWPGFPGQYSTNSATKRPNHLAYNLAKHICPPGGLNEVHIVSVTSTPSRQVFS